METPRYRIHHVAAITGVHPSTLRAWERRYGLLAPFRTPSGHRLYTGGEVERVRRIARLANEGTPYGRISELLERPEPAAEDGAATGAELLRAYRGQAERSLSEFDGAALEALYRRALGMLSFEEVFARLFLPLLVDVGDRWHAGENVVAEEHFLSMFTRRKLLAYMNALAPGREAARVVCANAPGELHEVGLLFFSLKLLARGLPVAYLGPGTPSGSLLHVVRSTAPAAVCLSATMEDGARALAGVLDELGSQPGRPAVIVGGLASAALGDAVPNAGVCGDDAEAGLLAVQAAVAAK